MLFETVNQNSKDKSPVPNMAAMVLQSILSGSRYPSSIYTDVLIRIRAEQGKVTWGRAGIIKAYLMRNGNWKEGENYMGLNEESRETSYVLGRLFSVLESIQMDTNPGIKATIRDRYFNSACATPASIFPVLIKLKNSHMKKLEREQGNMLLNQIRSHFFYHTLNALQALIVLKPEAAYKMAGDFARYLRFTLDSVTADGGIGSFREEIRAVRAYADINQQQLGDRLHMVYEIPDVDFPIPLLTIQPIVENAILHGIKPKVGGGTVSLKLEELPDHWQVTVTDDGVGFGLEAVREKGSIGLENVRRRIARFPGSELRITSTVGMGTQAVLTYGKRGKNMENLSKST